MNRDQSIEQRIGAWLEEQGYPIEMSVAQAFRLSGFAVRQSEFYFDVFENTYREIDVFAHAQRDLDGRLLRVGFPIECKLALSKPWLVFTDASIRLAEQARVAQRAASKLGTAFLRKVALKDGKLPFWRIVRTPERPGYGVTEAFTCGKDRAYEALMAATGAARGLATQLDKSDVTAVFFPAVVLGGRLFECFLVENGEIAVEQTRSTALVWHLVTLSGLDKLVEQAQTTVELLMQKTGLLAEAVGRPRDQT